MSAHQRLDMWSWCEVLLHELHERGPGRDPLARVLKWAAACIDRRIVVLGYDELTDQFLPAVLPLGLRLSLPGVDYLLVDRRLSDRRREEVVLHLLGHVLFDHPTMVGPCAVEARGGSSSTGEVPEPDSVEARAEAEATLFAARVLTRVNRPAAA